MRELQNVIERACALADGDPITRRDLPDHVLSSLESTSVTSAPDATLAGSRGMPLKDAKERWMQVLEAAYLRDLLDQHGGNISAAAKAAGIDRKTFHRLVNKYQLRGS